MLTETSYLTRARLNFKPERKIIPGPAGHEFPPAFATPGSVGDANYGPLVRIVNAANVIYNAPMVAFDVNAEPDQLPQWQRGL